MTPWPEVRLGEVLSHRKEFITIDDLRTYKRPRVQLHAKGVVLRDEVLGAVIKTKKQQVCRSGELLVAEIDAKVGGFGIVPAALAGAIVSSHYFLFVPEASRLDVRFLDWFIRTPGFHDQVEAQGSTNYAAIRPGDVLGYQIPLPPLEEQRRIVKRIETLAAQIHAASALKAETRQQVSDLGSSALLEAFGPALLAPVEPLRSVCSSVIDNLHSTPRYDGDAYPCIRSQDIGWGTLNYKTALRTSEAGFVERTRRGEPQQGDIVFVREGDVGRCAIVDGSTRFSLGQRVMMLRPSQERIRPAFLMLQLMSGPVLKDQILTTKTGTTSHHVNIKTLKAVGLKIPPLPVQDAIVGRLEGLRAACDTLFHLQMHTERELGALLPSILDKAFKREL